MKILMIGGTGFISGAVVKKLLERKHEVTILTRGLSKNNLSDDEKLKVITGDRRDKNLLKKISEENSFDVLYDMIAFTKEDSENIVEVFGGKIPRLIHTSTVSVYMVSHDVRNPITEDQDKFPLMEFWDRNPFGMQYGIDKRGCEDVLWKAHRENKFQVSMIRPPYVCGPNDNAKRDYFWIERILDGAPLLIPGSGDYATQTVYIEDLAKAFADLIETDKTIGKAYNIASEEILSLNDYLERLTYILNRYPDRINVDLDVFEKLPFSTSSEGHAFPFNTYRTAIFSIDRAKEDINFTSTPFEKWMPETINYYISEYSGSSVGYSNRNKEIEFAEQWENEVNYIKKKLISF